MASSAAAQSCSSPQSPSPYSPVVIPGGFLNVADGCARSQPHAVLHATRQRSANVGSYLRYRREAKAVTAAKSAVAQDVLNGAVPEPITTLGKSSCSGGTKPQKCVLVCLCHTPPSESCIVSIHSMFHRASARRSGAAFPDSGIRKLTRPIPPRPQRSTAQRSVAVVMPELTTYRP